MKRYIKPEIDIVEVKMRQLLAGSDLDLSNVGGDEVTDPGQQLAPENLGDLLDFE
mgnify:CR=1 FL=1